MVCTTICTVLSCFAFTIAVFKLLEFYLRKKKLGDIVNRHVLITGCDSGFGYSLAKRLDKLGVPVFASCLTENGQTTLRNRCSSRLNTLRLDVTNDRSIQEAVQCVLSKLPEGKGLWGLVNNAGLQVISAPLELYSRSAIEKTLAVNLIGVMEVTKAFLPLLRKSKGRIVSVSSDAALIAWPCRSAYNISKVGVESLSSCIRKEMYHVGVTAHCVEPGAFRTHIVDTEEMCSTLQKAYEATDINVRNFYGKGWLDQWKEGFRGIPKIQNPDLSPVTGAIEHALFSRFPKTRYRCGKDCQYTYWPISLMPDSFQDWYYAMPSPEGAR